MKFVTWNVAFYFFCQKVVSAVCVYVAIVSTYLILWKVEETTRFEKISINMCMVILDYVSWSPD